MTRLSLAFMLLAIVKVVNCQCQFIVADNDRLYAEKYNLVSILFHGKEVDPEQHQVIIGSADYLETDSGLYVKPRDREVFISVISKKNRDTLAVKRFTTIALPEPLFALDGKVNGGEISAYDLNLLKGVTAIVQFHSYNYSILSYQVTFRFGNEIVTLENIGALFSDSIRRYIRHLKPYDQIIFHDFRTDPFRVFSRQILLTIKSLNFVKEDYENLCLDTEGLLFPYAECQTFEASETKNIRVKSNCSSDPSKCILEVSSIGNGTSYVCHFHTQDSVTIDFFYNRVRLAEFSYFQNVLSGPFMLFSIDGDKYLEGRFKRGSSIPNKAIVIDPVSLVETTTNFEVFPSLKDGDWLYYDGERLMQTLKFANGKLIN